ncbi:hypothetical protein ORV05_12385 [Amycolatopsis cynarae]|uniref:Uncharacterized protein n=1 Tax=Amycolatopsis cynarae TaxID=2995223 RepID=A0ABY7BAU2_9PSEU|nr:hypothetical protein [Amycolatopsis sp. HUAS 11-8]WAL68529.1 hypothetical protein ORV05_12385 [Amycolatopsis sp. HUAS 11-8]
MRESPGDRRTVEEVLEGIALRLLGVADTDSGMPSLAHGWRAVAGYEVVPRYTVAISGENAGEVIDRLWHAAAEELSIYSEDADFLLDLPAPRQDRTGWLRARDLRRARLPSRIHSVTGSWEFIALSENGRRLCAVSKEEYDYWIVARTFTDEQVRRGRESEDRVRAVEREVRNLADRRASLQEVIAFLGSAELHGPLRRITVVGMLVKACGLSVVESRKIASMVEYPSGRLLAPAEQVEEAWRNLVTSGGGDPRRR